MIIAIVSLAGWLLMLFVVLALASAAKRGDERADRKRRARPVASGEAKILVFDVVGAGHASVQESVQ